VKTSFGEFCIFFVPFGNILTAQPKLFLLLLQSGQCTGKTLFEGGYTPGSSVFLDISNIDGFTAGANVTGNEKPKKKKKTKSPLFICNCTKRILQ